MTVSLKQRYLDKSVEYYGQVNEPLLGLISGSKLRILDVGCGCGANGRYLFEHGVAEQCVGVEMVPEHAATARRHLDEVHTGMIDQMDFPWSDESFDCIVLGDVLEHLVDPWDVLRLLRRLLAPQGFLVASIPNVQHISVIGSLALKGEWKYHHDGILDVTHLRFFTRRSTRRLFEETGYEVAAMRPYFSGRRYSMASRLSAGLLNGWMAQRWLTRATKTTIQ